MKASRLLLFSIEPFRCALPIERVQEVIRMVAVSPLPQSPACVEGTINLRGTVIPVIDLRKRFGCPSHAYEVRTRVLIVSLYGRAAGLIVDDVLEVAEVADNEEDLSLGESLGMDAGLVARVVRVNGVTWSVLDVEKLLPKTEQASFNAWASGEQQQVA